MLWDEQICYKISYINEKKNNEQICYRIKKNILLYMNSNMLQDASHMHNIII